jgi:transposase
MPLTVINNVLYFALRHFTPRWVACLSVGLARVLSYPADRVYPASNASGYSFPRPGVRSNSVYEATPSRSRDGPLAFLKGFAGYVQADAFGGYDGLYATGAVEVACWAHARRKWYDARDSDPRLAHEALARIRVLYDIEALAKELSTADRAELRRREATPVLTAFADWLATIRPAVLPKSPVGQAVTYAANQWAALNRYVEDGDLAIDNNVAERALRGVPVGRKNWLFWGSAGAGPRPRS